MRDLVWLRLSLLALIGCGMLISLTEETASAQPVHDFYRGKTLTVETLLRRAEYGQKYGHRNR